MEEGENKQPTWQYQPESQPVASTPPNAAYHGGAPLEELPLVSWSASEYIAHQKSFAWYVLLWIGAFILGALIYLITHDVMAVIVILVIALAFAVFAARQPKTIEYSLSEDGVHVGERYYPYAAFKSFAIVEEGAVDSIWLRPLKRFTQPVAMYYSPEDEEHVIDMLANFLPQEMRELDIYDRAARKLRF